MTNSPTILIRLSTLSMDTRIEEFSFPLLLALAGTLGLAAFLASATFVETASAVFSKTASTVFSEPGFASTVSDI